MIVSRSSSFVIEPSSILEAPSLPSSLSAHRDESPVHFDSQPVSAVPMGARIKVDRLQLEDLASQAALNKAFDFVYEDLLNEVLQSDSEQPSIPEVILAVITEMTSDQSVRQPSKEISPYYSRVHRSVVINGGDSIPTPDLLFSDDRSFRRRTIRTTRRFVGPDGRPEEIVTMKTVEPFADYSSRLTDR